MDKEQSMGLKYEYLLKYIADRVTEAERRKYLNECRFIEKTLDVLGPGFVMTYKQYKLINMIFMEKFATSSCGLNKLQLHPKNNFLVLKEWSTNILELELPWISENIPYFRMIFNGNFARDWIKVSELVDTLKAEPYFVTLTFDDGNSKLYFYDQSREIEIAVPAFFGGGRVYSKEHAHEWNIMTKSFQNYLSRRKQNPPSKKRTFTEYSQVQASIFNEKDGIYMKYDIHLDPDYSEAYDRHIKTLSKLEKDYDATISFNH